MASEDGGWLVETAASLARIRDALAATTRGRRASLLVEEALARKGVDYARLVVRARYWLPLRGEVSLPWRSLEAEPLPPFTRVEASGVAVPLGAARGPIVVVDARGRGCRHVLDTYRGLETRGNVEAVVYVSEGPLRCPLYSEPLPPRAEDPRLPAAVAYGPGAEELLRELPVFLTIHAAAEEGYGYAPIYLAPPEGWEKLYLVSGYDHWLEGASSAFSTAAAIDAYSRLRERGLSVGLVLLTATVYGEDVEWSLYWGSGARRLSEALSAAGVTPLFLALESLGLGGPSVRGSPVSAAAAEAAGLGYGGVFDAYTSSSWLRGAGPVAVIAPGPERVAEAAATPRDSFPGIEEGSVRKAARAAERLAEALLAASGDAIVEALAALFRLATPLPLPWTRRELYRLLRAARLGGLDPLLALASAERILLAPLAVGGGRLCSLLDRGCMSLLRRPPMRLVYADRVLGDGDAAVRLLDSLVSSRLRLVADIAVEDLLGDSPRGAPPN